MPADDGKISSKARISGLDRANDLFEVDDVSLSATKSATVNDMLGLTSAPLGTTEAQSPTNKTFDNTNTVTVKDTLFTLQDDGDVTKQAKFQLSGITTGTTRTYTMPNASGTLMDLASAQSASNKTFVSPILTTPTINNPTLNTDAISEFTASNGVTIAGMNVKSGKLNTNNSVVTANITDAAATPAKLVAGTGASWAWQAWTPTLTNLTLGNGTQVATYTQIGKTVVGRWSFTLGTTSTVGTGPTFSLPVAATANAANNGIMQIGVAYFLDSGVTNYIGSLQLATTTTGLLTITQAGSTYVQLGGVTASVPFAFGNLDQIVAEFFYEAA